MNNLERTKHVGEFIHKIDRLADASIDLILKHVPYLADDDIEQVALSMGRLEKGAYIVRGLCGSTMRHRYESRRDSGDPRTLQKQLTKLSTRWGISYRTLIADINIYEKFFLPERLPDPETTDNFGVEEFFADVSADDVKEAVNTIVLEHVPPRYIAQECLVAPNPHEALDMAMTKYGVGDYTEEQVREDIKAIRLKEARKKDGLFAGNGGIPKAKTTDTLLDTHVEKIRLTYTQRSSLYDAARRAGVPAEELIGAWIDGGCQVQSKAAQC